jgi:hypothetical protein
MSLDVMIEYLRARRDAVSEAITALEVVAQWSQKRRGRPPKWRSLLGEIRSNGRQPAQTPVTSVGVEAPKAKNGLSHQKAAGRT